MGGGCSGGAGGGCTGGDGGSVSGSRRPGWMRSGSVSGLSIGDGTGVIGGTSCGGGAGGLPGSFDSRPLVNIIYISHRLTLIVQTDLDVMRSIMKSLGVIPDTPKA